MNIQGMAFLSRHVCWQPQSNTSSVAVPEWIHAAKDSVEHLDPAPWKYTPESLDLARNLFTMSHRKYIIPSFLPFISISVGSVPTVRDLGPGEQIFVKSRGKPLDR